MRVLISAFLSLGLLLLGCPSDEKDGAQPVEPVLDTVSTGGGTGAGSTGPGSEVGAEAGADIDQGSGFVPKPGFGTPCEDNSDCETGWCVVGPDGGVCTQTCLEECPEDWVCKGVTNSGGDLTFLCVPKQRKLCEPCETVGDCGGGPGDRCLVLPGEGLVCSETCGADDPCPGGYVCKPDDTTGESSCFPTTASCICGEDELGTVRPCKDADELGTCWGFQECVGAGGWGPCSATQPLAEQCNGVDDDCDGLTDEELGGETCQSQNDLGVCVGALECVEGIMSCSAPPPVAELCDGVDNDCNGLTDEHEGDLDMDGEPDCSDDDIDGDGDPNLSDCEPWDNTVFTGAPEQCNGKDDDCDGLVGLSEQDADGDKMWPCQGDCNDTSPTVYLGAPELCDGVDTNCDTILPADEVDVDMDGALACDDCDDTTETVGPGALEVCDGVDNDCDDLIDEAGAAGCQSYYADADKDGAGAGDPACLCAASEAYPTHVPGDCNPEDSSVSPLANEICNALDDDCDTLIDEPGAQGCKPYLVDTDLDGFGATGDAACLCKDPGGSTAITPGDCNDDDPLIFPGQAEVCDGVDTNCDKILPLDEQDLDEDSWMACAGDCNDNVNTVYPGAEEICDGFDSNCDDIKPPEENDGDKDGFPVCAGDCDDWADKTFPGGLEVCGGKDENCDMVVDEPNADGCVIHYPDADGDGFGVSDEAQCLCAPTDTHTVTLGSDCADDNALEHPGTNHACEDDAGCCQPQQTCQFNHCVDGPAPCGDDDDCWGDTYCIGSKCIPFGIGPAELAKEDCDKLNLAGLFLPTLQCAWTGPPEGDAFPDHVNVLGTPIVGDFDLDHDPETTRPSIVFVSYMGEDGGKPAATSNGIVRVLDGNTCKQLYTLDGATTAGSSPLALGDLDLASDDRPEIVAHREGGGLVAFKYDSEADTFAVHWVATANGVVDTTAAQVNRWNGPSIIELDGDDHPEILMSALVYDHTGKRIADNLGYVNYAQGVFPFAADVDLDNKIELIDGNSVWEWTGSSWKEEAYVTTKNGVGHAAVADFGDFPVPGLPAGIAEVAVIRGGTAVIQDLSGKIVFGPIQLPSWPPGSTVGTGGPPTIGDFDGDGVPEFAAAGRGAYSIFDIDCLADPLPLGCHSPGVLWFRQSQDFSSSVTGSSIYDFEADGLAEAVYADECFTRIYEGLTGEVVFSQWRSSCTWNENPVVADTDGDFKAELVIGSNTNCNVVCPDLDPIHRGLVCQDDGDCPTASALCSVGRCRCQSDADCGPAESNYACTDPLPNTPGIGNVCRATHGGEVPGIRVYRDVADGWVVARPVWSQHAYTPSSITDKGRLIPFGQQPPHWQIPGHNNYRQNAQGDFDPTLAPDMTAKPGLILNCDDQDQLSLPLEVCNRGALPVAEGVTVGFFDGDPLTIGAVICLTTTQTLLMPEECEQVVCMWTVPDDEPHNIHAFVDFGGPKGENKECLEGNNQALWKGVTCANW